MYDYYLRLDLQAALYIAEKSLKASISYVFSECYGENHHQYLDPVSFDTRTHSELKVSSLIHTMNELIAENCRRGNNAIWHYVHQHGYVPLWVLFTVASFGNVSVFYANMKDREKDKIAAQYGLTASELRSMMYLLTHARNACAHGHRMYTFGYDVKRPVAIPYTSVHRQLDIADTEGRRDVLATIICLYSLLPSHSFGALCHSLQARLTDIKHERFFAGVVNKTNLRFDYLTRLGKPYTYKS